jgi:hypothetical protein
LYAFLLLSALSHSPHDSPPDQPPLCTPSSYLLPCSVDPFHPFASTECCLCLALPTRACPSSGFCGVVLSTLAVGSRWGKVRGKERLLSRNKKRASIVSALKRFTRIFPSAPRSETYLFDGELQRTGCFDLGKQELAHLVDLRRSRKCRFAAVSSAPLLCTSVRRTISTTDGVAEHDKGTFATFRPFSCRCPFSPTP